MEEVGGVEMAARRQEKQGQEEAEEEEAVG